MSTFETKQPELETLIHQIKTGELQLPDFQRGWVWDDEHIRSLLVSIARSFPVGAVMLLETGGPVNFKVRAVENVEFSGETPSPKYLILDGQQRLTSLTQVLALNKPVKTFTEKGQEIERYYYIDIEAALNGQFDDAFISVGKDKTVKTNFDRDFKQIENGAGQLITLDFSTTEKEYESMFFPCSLIFNSHAWEMGLLKYNQDKYIRFADFKDKVLQEFKSYKIPVIQLNKNTSKDAVCLVFEKVNTGGVPLSVFELVTASFAAENDKDNNLREDWYGDQKQGIEGRFQRIVENRKILSKLEPTDFLQVISLLTTYDKRQIDRKEGKTGKLLSAVSAKRQAVLTLTLQDYKQWANAVEIGFTEVASFLTKQCFFSERELPYRGQLIPLAAIMTKLAERKMNWREPKILQKLEQWFWCGVLGELYGGAAETRTANDLEDFIAWVENDETIIRTIFDASFQPERLETLRSRQSAAYKGINTLVLREGAKDFFWNETIQQLDLDGKPLDIHHIFPQQWCKEKGIKPAVYDSIINKTPLSASTNRAIGGKAPSIYLNRLQNFNTTQYSDEQMDSILEGHLIPTDEIRKDDFESFMRLRAENLIHLIYQTMGKTLRSNQFINQPTQVNAEATS